MTWTSDVVECLESAVREVLADQALSSADLVGILEDLVPGDDVTEDIRHPGDGWNTPPSRRLARGGAWVAFGSGEPNCWIMRLPGHRPRPLWPQDDAENERLSQLIRGEL